MDNFTINKLQKQQQYDYPLVKNVHLYVQPPTATGKTYLAQGNFTYFHYKCDKFDDIGWGCGYRTLQSMCSWIINALDVNTASSSSLSTPPPPPSSLFDSPLLSSPLSSASTLVTPSSSSLTTDATLTPTTNEDVINVMVVADSVDVVNNDNNGKKLIINSAVNDDDNDDNHIPSITDIQSILVNISDKPQSFLGSREWIGTLEVFYVIDTLYDITCRILHIPNCEDLKKYANIVKKYFEDYGGLIMMGGDIDASSKGIAGIHISGNQAYFLVIDPHFVGKAKTPQELVEKNYVRWQHTSQFIDSSFYNLCLPQVEKYPI